jgi:hypothetical protein
LCKLHWLRWWEYGDPLVEKRLKHGHARGRGTPEYKTWERIIQRSFNPHDPRYADWGGRGITACEGYRKFENFFADLGEKPEPTALYSIDRFPLNSGGYWCGKCPECLANGWTFNVRWATAKEQANNRRLPATAKVKGANTCQAK